MERTGSGTRGVGVVLCVYSHGCFFVGLRWVLVAGCVGVGVSLVNVWVSFVGGGVCFGTGEEACVGWLECKYKKGVLLEYKYKKWGLPEYNTGL